MRLDIIHEFLKPEFPIHLCQLAKALQIKIKKYAVSHLSPSFYVLFTPIDADR